MIKLNYRAPENRHKLSDKFVELPQPVKLVVSQTGVI
jgi:hypothetical protein